MTTKSSKIVMARRFDGMPQVSDFALQEETLAPLEDGDVLCETVWLSVDPYMRSYSRNMKEGDVMMGQTLSKVVESRHPNYVVGDLVLYYSGWRDQYVVKNPDDPRPWPLQKVNYIPEGHPSTLSLGVLGMPGATAYFGLNEICKPVKSGETVVVNAAAGAVGAVVGQLAKSQGCRVVGFAGTDEKVEYLRELGFDEAVNYKTMGSLEDVLCSLCPNGIDIYFDNVGGSFSDTVMSHMNQFGRVSVCGCISQYNNTGQSIGPRLQGLLISKQIRMEGFLVHRWKDQWMECMEALGALVREGKMKYRETTVDGFERAPEALIGMLQGENIGKMIVKCQSGGSGGDGDGDGEQCKQ
ncbi:prostaglandin reductase 1-like [Sycon ciliatum]|uniref:prostaglandin reductase 1-like n=1 Tax=Sycon ciliatum TaxID=27933 RepID=UPI0031F60D9B